MQWKVPFSNFGTHYEPEDIQTVVRAMQEANPQTQGEYQRRFEAAFANFVGVSSAHAVSSGTAALELAAVLSGLKPGDEVIIPGHTFCATAVPFGRTGAKLIWADIHPKTWVTDALALERAWTPRTKAIVVVHLYGLPCPMDPIMAFARAKNLIVIEDCAQALGATIHGQKVGSFGDYACFSFHTHKNITTLGEGGMLVVRDPERARKVPGLRHNGIRPFEREAGADYWLPAMSNVDEDLPAAWPYNVCLGEPQCALGERLLGRVEEINAVQRRRAHWFHKQLSKVSTLEFQEIPEGYRSAHYCLPMRYIGSSTYPNRDAVMKKLTHDHGIQCVIQYHPLYRYPLFQKKGMGQHDCPETDRFFDQMFSVPFHFSMGDEDLEEVAEAVAEVCGA